MAEPGSGMNDRNEYRDGGMVVYPTNKNIEVEDWQDKIYEVSVEDSKFFTMSTKGKSQSCKNREFNWMEYNEDSPHVITSGATITSSSDPVSTQIQLSSFSMRLNGLVKDSILLFEWIDSTGTEQTSHYRVVRPPVINDDNQTKTFKIVKIVNQIGDTNNIRSGEKQLHTANDAAEINALRADGARIYILHTSKPEAFEDYHPVKRYVENTKNYISVLSDETSISFTKAAEIWRANITQRDWQVAKLMKKHAHDLERMYLFGAGFCRVSREENRHMSKGLFEFDINSDIFSTKGYGSGGSAVEKFTYKAFSHWVMTRVHELNDKEEMTGWCNPAFLQYMIDMLENSSMVKMNLMASGTPNSFGINVKKLVTPHCDINLMTNKCLAERFGHTPVLLVCDMNKITTRYLAGNGENFATKLEKDLQIPTATYHLDRVSSGYGLEVQNCETVSWLKVVDYPEPAIVVPPEP